MIYKIYDIWNILYFIETEFRTFTYTHVIFMSSCVSYYSVSFIEIHALF